MKIAVDCRKIKDGGIGVYLRNLLYQWHKSKVAAQFFLFHLPGDESLLKFDDGFAELIPHEYRNYSPGELFSFAGPLKRIGADLFWNPHYTLPLGLPCPAIVTIHDLIHLEFRPRFGVLGTEYAKFMIGRACRRARIILTVSEHSKNDIAREFPASREKIRVIPNGVNGEVFRPLPAERVTEFQKNYRLPELFVLYVGALKKHKNPQALVEIVNKLDTPLVIASHDERIYQTEILAKIEKREAVRLVKLNDENEMALLYNAARLLVQPSFYEGFGLPPLEAMACGLPVVCSNLSSLPEVVGDAAELFDPHDLSGMLEHLKHCWRNDGHRDILRARGIQKARLFDWGKSASEIFCLMREAANK